MKVIKGELRYDRFMIPYRVYGEAAKTMICVSGAQQTMAIWKSCVSYFSPDHRVVVFDLPGQGRSKTLSGEPAVTLAEQVDVLRRVIDVTKAKRPLHIASASWGTIVAAAFASRFPTAVDKVILGGFGIKPSKEMKKVIKDGQRLYDENRGDLVGRLIVDRFGHNIPASYKGRIIDQFRCMDRDKFLAFYAHCDFVESSGDINDLINLQNIKAKTLIVNGEKDAILDLEDVEVASQQIPDCEVKIIPDVGHFLHFERSDILGIYREFFSR